MESIYNIKGTHHPSWKISKRGPTTYQGILNPLNSLGEDGDLFIQHSTGNESLYQKIGGVWIPFTRGRISTTVITTPFTFTNEDIAFVNQTIPNPTTIFTPSAPNINKEIVIKDSKGDANINNITVEVSGGGTIDGKTSHIIDVEYEAITLIWNGSEWNII